MRELKFRAWDGHYMQYGCELDSKGRSIYRDMGCTTYNDCVMQYTGLKDKNGVEIYEGDILGLEDPEDNSIQQVVFHNGKFQGYFIGGDDWHVYVDILEEFIVIGNIYENPELL